MSSRLNALNVAGRPMLLTRTATGTSIHLTTEVTATDARAATPDGVDRSRKEPADELLDDRWSPVALCGRPWTVMADDFADHTGRVVARPEASTCRQCLGVIDKAFPTPIPDCRIGVLADLAATAVSDHGTAEIVGVPGDQMNALRRAVRTEVRQRFGFPMRTFTQDGLLVVSSPETFGAPPPRGSGNREHVGRLGHHQDRSCISCASCFSPSVRESDASSAIGMDTSD